MALSRSWNQILSLIIGLSLAVIYTTLQQAANNNSLESDAKAIDVINAINDKHDSMLKQNNLMLYLKSIIESEIDCESVNKLFKLFIAGDVVSFLFSDLCNEILIYTKDDLNKEDNEVNRKLKLSMNEHFIEDGTHWKMYINDWVDLNLNDIDYDHSKLSDFMSYFFSDITKWNRLAIYRFIQYDAKLNGDKYPIHRYIFIDIIEHNGQNLFGLLTKIHDIYNKKCNQQWDGLKFISNVHSDVENGNLQIENNNDLQLFNNVKIETENEKLLLHYASKYLEVLDNYWEELYQFMTKTNQQQKIWNFNCSSKQNISQCQI